jgi:hypothetical protein
MSKGEAAEHGEQQEGWKRTLAQMFELYFTPEIERRRIHGGLPGNFYLYMAQVLFPPVAEPPIILLNDEVKGTALLRAPRNIQQGEQISANDLQYIERFDLPDELLDNGYFTVVRAGEGWSMFFNFLYGRARAKDMLELAEQFLEAALFSKARGDAGPAVDNLFSASELISKAVLILHRNHAADAKTHGRIHSEINAWARLGNIDQAFVALYNKLADQRPSARYGNSKNRPPIPDDESFELVRAMIATALQRVGNATDRETVKLEQPGDEVPLRIATDRPHRGHHQS